jgi:poly[(R)-3-hydroxyalkanoate] polymerase subunit PhaC
MSLPPFVRDLNPTAMPGLSPEEQLRALTRYNAGVRAILESLDAPVGRTPAEVVWTLNKAKLYHYLPTRPESERYPIPVLLVYALINKPFIFDFGPGRSFVEYMVGEGFDVYLLDWGAPGPEDRSTTFDDYATQYLARAVRKVLRTSGAAEISMLGYCLGANIALIYAALHPEVPLRNLILLTIPADFSASPEGSMAMWLEKERLDVDKMLATWDNVPGELIRFWAKMLKPAENFVGSYVNLYKYLDNKAFVEAWQAINRWIEDVIPFAGAAMRQFVIDYVRNNELVTGKHYVDGRLVDLSKVRAALLSVCAQYDHLVSRAQGESIMELVSSTDKEFRVLPSTHVGLMANINARQTYWPGIAEWLAARSGRPKE